jgi:hypothetical protein
MDLENLGSLVWVYLGIMLVYAAFSIYMMVWAYRRKGAVGLLLALFLNWVGWIIVACLPKDRERERELLDTWNFNQSPKLLNKWALLEILNLLFLTAKNF